MATNPDRPEPSRRSARARVGGPAGAETRPSWKTSELLVFLILAIGIFIAAEDVGSTGDNAFASQRAWLYVTILGAAYIVSRGLAKSGSRATEEHDPRSPS